MKIKVAVAVIKDNIGRCLITRRSEKKSHGGLWEFPGGKLEENEVPIDALKREIIEEVGLTIFQPVFLKKIEHDYGAKYIEFFVYLVTKFEGQAICAELQPELRWVRREDLDKFQFPAANLKFIPLIT